MKAAVLYEFGSELKIEEMPDLRIGSGEVVVDVVATGILPYTKHVLSGERKYPMTLPMVPGAGAIGRIRELGPDSTHLKVGEWVSCDPTVRSRDDALSPDITLQGASARGAGGLRLQNYYRHGSFAEQIRVPTENVYPIGQIKEADASKWCAQMVLIVPLGGLLAIDLKPGETIVISGATGNFGSGAVMMALALGASRVVAPGRNEKTLADLVRRFGARVKPVQLTGDEKIDRDQMMQAADGPIDCVFDILPPQVPASVVRSALMTVRESGRVALMGGVGMLGGEELSLPYPWIMRNNITIKGKWMYPREANVQLIRMIRAGLVDLNQFESRDFPLVGVNQAIADAAANGKAFMTTVLRPAH